MGLAGYGDAQDVTCAVGLENVRYCRPEGGEGQPTMFFCAICSMTCWTHDKFGLTTVSLESLRDRDSHSLVKCDKMSLPAAPTPRPPAGYLYMYLEYDGLMVLV